MGKMINSVFLFLLVGLVVVILSGYLVNEVMDQHQLIKDQTQLINIKDARIAELDQKIVQLNLSMDEKNQQNDELQAELDIEQQKSEALNVLLEVKQLELIAKDAELATARQDLYQALEKLAVTKENWQKTTVALIETWQDYEQARKEANESQAILDMAIQQLVKTQQEKEILLYQAKLASLNVKIEAPEYSSMLPAVIVANLLVMFPMLRSMLNRKQ
jgi:hypothetical protein